MTQETDSVSFSDVNPQAKVGVVVDAEATDSATLSVSESPEIKTSTESCESVTTEKPPKTDDETLSDAGNVENGGVTQNDTQTAGKTDRFCEGSKCVYTSLPDHITLDNLTLGRGKTYVEWEAKSGITLADEYAPDGRLWMETKEVKIEKTENGFKVTPKEGVTGQLSFDVFYNEGKRATFHLTVNPDPWSLWTEKDPTVMVFPDDAERVKQKHQSKIKYEDDAFTVIGASRRGRSHEHSGTFRDDDLGLWEDKATGRYVFIVADGAGSAKFSREGSRKAIEFLREKLPANLTVGKWDEDGAIPQPNGKIGVMLATLAYKAYESIDKYVRSENEKHPEDKWEVRDFNTTLLIAAVKIDSDGGMRLVTFSIGDGAIAWFDSDKSGLMCAPDGGEFSGGTRFLTTRSVWEKAGKDYQAFYKERVFCKSFTPEETKRTTLFLMTDGVSDPWFETDAALNDTKMWCRFTMDTLFGEGENKAGLKQDDTVDTKAKKLMDWLHFKIPGNHDDRTLIMVQPRNKKLDSAVNMKEVANA
ncbi:MAG: protein phosphatase 2C domain-containing protein [Victivallales bacterium]|nr:protein phosphatase 2C domain-containing protein [Victivallales bacterium]